MKTLRHAIPIIFLVALLGACSHAPSARVVSPSPSTISSDAPAEDLPSATPSATSSPANASPVHYAPPPPPTPLPGLSLPLSGQLPYPLLVQIENTSAARPQAGLGSASVVFQYLTEGGITRLSALFQRVPGVVGPVRSARFVSVYLYQRFGALLVASGGSTWTYQRIHDTGIYALINDFDHGGHFFRWSGRVAPHNLYISQSRLVQVASIGARPGRTTDFARSDAWPGTNPAANVSIPALRSSFAYSGGTYSVNSDGAPEVDVASGPVRATVVLVMHVPQWTTNMQEDGYGGLARDYDLAHGGAFEAYARGTVVQGRWATTGDSGMITLTGADGQPLALPNGLVWAALAP